MSKKEQKRRKEKKKEKKYHREQGRAKHDHGAKGTDEAEVNRSGLLVANPDVNEDGGQEDQGVHRVTSHKVLSLKQRNEKREKKKQRRKRKKNLLGGVDVEDDDV